MKYVLFCTNHISGKQLFRHAESFDILGDLIISIASPLINSTEVSKGAN